jgi:hypothetical protein
MVNDIRPLTNNPVLPAIGFVRPIIITPYLEVNPGLACLLMKVPYKLYD